MATTRPDSSAQSSQDAGSLASSTEEVVETVDLIGNLEDGPAGFVRLRDGLSRKGRYVEIKIEDIVRLSPDDTDRSAERTVIAVRGATVVLMCTPAEAQMLPDLPTAERPQWPR